MKSYLLVVLALLSGSTTLARAESADGSGASAVELAVVYTGDILRNTRGGLQTGGTYLDNLDVTLAVDGEALWGVPGLELFLYGLYNNDNTFSDRYVGDDFVVSNIDTDRAIRLYEAWAQWRLNARGSATLRFGLYDLNSEFDAIDARGLFLNSTYGIGLDFSQSGENGPSIFPSTSLAMRLAWQPTENTQLEVAVLDGVPGDPDDPAETTVRLSRDEGALIVAEFTRNLSDSVLLSAGYWRYTADFEVLALPPGGEPPASQDNNQGVYLNGEVAVSDQSSVFVRGGAANGELNHFDRYYAAGWVWRNLLPGARGDSLGIAAAAGRSSSIYRQAQAATGAPIDDYEYNAELTWRIPAQPWLTLQPNIQFIRNPGLVPARRDALVVGLRFELAFAWR